MRDVERDYKEIKRIVKGEIELDPLFPSYKIDQISHSISKEIEQNLKVKNIEPIIRTRVLHYEQCVGINEIDEGIGLLKNAIAWDMIQIKYFDMRNEVEISCGLRPDPIYDDFQDVKFVDHELFDD